MKIALCLSGFVRDYNITYVKWKKFFIDKCQTDGHHLDIFIASWNDNKFDKHKYPINIDDVINLYKPTAYVFGPNIELNLDKYKKITCSPFVTLCNYYKIKESYELAKKQNVVYDLVIRTRMDMNINENLANSIINCDRSKLNIFSRQDDINLKQVSDILFVGTPDIINDVCMLYDKFEFIYDKIQLICPHISLTWYINEFYKDNVIYHTVENDILVRR